MVYAMPYGWGGIMNGSRFVVWLLILVAVALSAQAVRAETYTAWTTGNLIAERCRAEGAVEAAYCAGFVVAIAETVNAATVWNAKACIPAQVTTGQLMDITKKYLSDHPELRHYVGASLVAHAFMETFPCK